MSFGKLLESTFSFDARTSAHLTPTNWSALGVKKMNVADLVPSVMVARKLYLH